MYRFLKSSYNHLPDKEGIDEGQLNFCGFDGNNESKLMGYAIYIVKDLGRYNEFKDADLNSHMPMLAKYRRMLSEWEKSQDNHNLTKQDILRIISA
jgi:uncharacterized protein YfbU (UPF0304 family)